MSRPIALSAGSSPGSSVSGQMLGLQCQRQPCSYEKQGKWDAVCMDVYKAFHVNTLSPEIGWVLLCQLISADRFICERVGVEGAL